MRKAIRFLLAVLIVFALLLTVDTTSGFFYRTSTQMSVATTSPEGIASRTLLVFPGYAGDCHSISTAFAPRLIPGWQMVVLCYPEREIDDDQVFDLLRRYVEEAPQGSVTILAGSMGGMVAVNFLDRLARTNSNLRPDVRLLLDTSPPDRAFVKMSSFLPMSAWYRGGPISSAIWYIGNVSMDHSALEPGASLDIVRQGDRYFREIGMPALASQANYINEFRLDDHLHFRDLLATATFITAGEGGEDPMIKVSTSIEAWRKRLPELRVSTLNSREGSWHVPWTLRPQEVLTVVMSDQ